jgi:hypothetical protein
MDLGNWLLKMERLHKTKQVQVLLYSLLISVALFLPLSSLGASSAISTGPTTEEIQKALGKHIQCKTRQVQVLPDKGKANTLKSLAIKFDDINLGQMAADHMTLIYEAPVIDLIQLKQSKELNILSYSKVKVGILISAGAIERYFDKKTKELKKRYNRISIKFLPPYIECFFDVPVSEISPETLQLLNKFIKGTNFEGYAAFQFKAKNNNLYALSSKVIVNHILIPELVLRELQTKFNPFDSIPILKPFQYSINSVTVQNKYLYLTN